MRIVILILVTITLTHISLGQIKPKTTKYTDAEIAQMIKAYRIDPKGPYRDIRWYCPDGSLVLPQERCPELGGVQRARYRDEVVALAKNNHVFLGQILSATEISNFWDSASHHSQAKQYQLEQYLRANGNGWVNRRAQFYRGAYQVEDEVNWGIRFFWWVLEDTTRTKEEFFFIRQSAKDIPHAAEGNLALNVRAVSKEISDEYLPFMDLRVKLHGQPQPSDIDRVKTFRGSNKSKLTPELEEKFSKLLTDMEELYKPVDINDLRVFTKKIPSSQPISATLNTFIASYGKTDTSGERCKLLASAAMAIRTEITKPMKPSARLALIDISNKMEVLINREAAAWQPATLRSQMRKVRTLGEAATGFGYFNLWEWQQLDAELTALGKRDLSLKELSGYVDNTRRMVEWGTGMVRATYEEVVKLYGGFEPLANGFVDDKVRGSVLLQLGSSVSILGDFFSAKAGFANNLMGISNQSAARGLNPGYAFGELVVTNQSPEDIEVSNDKIYVFNRPPADLKPVAGIATVTEGNMVSHVQLLARNLGIPNAVVSMENLTALLPFNGQKVLYAVSNKGTVIIKPEADMTEEEKALFTKKVRNEEKISVPVELMELNDAHVINLRKLNASNSGKVCGPKAANLGQLKQMFPDHVVEGLVIPFAVFKAHFDQPMPAQNMTYWEFLKGIFQQADALRESGKEDLEIETFVLSQLSILEKAIKQIELQPAFQAELEQGFQQVFGKKLGEVPVFIRSDTNMEDLKDFTGAGLNLTLFNVLDASLILQGIKDVWVSPYVERSYKWRQKYLLNPENVFPSILIIPSVDADCSGVLITKGVGNGNTSDNTVAFNRGVGGAVEGQASETWNLAADGTNLLLSPAREPRYMSIPETGGVAKLYTEFNNPILPETRLTALRDMAKALNDKLPTVGIKGPYDVELGFKDEKIWLFQVRPFVENKRAASSEYLRSITPSVDETLVISIDSPL
jgi:hypothetical protein